MKKIVSIALALLLLAPILPGFAQDANRVIKVTGTATVSLMADTATIQIGTNTKADTVSKAQSENNTIMQKVIAALEREGIAKEDIVTSYYDVSMRMDQVFGDSTADQAGNMYEVSNMLYVTIKDLDKLVQAIDSALAAGANSIYGLVFSSSKSTEAYHTALQRAVEDAQAKAKVLADAVGKELGDVITVTNEALYGGSFGARNAMDMIAGSEKGAAIITGDVSVTASVIVEYELK
jgi:uncharacterized protein YggE